MIPESAGTCLSALFIDFDNIYLSLRNRDEEAAARFSKNPALWLSRIISGGLIRDEARQLPVRRRLAVGRCYGNPVPRRIGREGPNDPSSFAFVRHNFMRAGLEVVDCPHLTSQFKNSSDIRIACDIRDFLDHPTRFNEFIILSGDADFTPVLLSLRSHDRFTVVYTNDYTSPYYKAFSDGRIEEEDLVRFLLEAELPEDGAEARKAKLGHGAHGRPALPGRTAPAAVPSPAAKRSIGHGDPAIQALIQDFKVIGQEILALVVEVVESSSKPVPIAYLADRAQKSLGHPKTVGTNWAGSGGFLNFLTQNLPDSLQVTDKPPQFVYSPAKHSLGDKKEPAQTQPAPQERPAVLHPSEPAAGNSGRLAELQRSITRIYEACQAPPLPPSEYQLLFTLIATEVRENGFAPGRSASAVVTRAAEAGLNLALKDVAFVIEAVDEIDPWLEHTNSPAAVARAYRDYVLTRCRGGGLNLTDDEYQLIQVWFGASQWGANNPTADRAGDGREPARGGQPLGLPGYGVPDGGLPPPSQADLPLPPDFAFDRGLDEQLPEPQQVKDGSLKLSFLKHG